MHKAPMGGPSKDSPKSASVRDNVDFICGIRTTHVASTRLFSEKMAPISNESLSERKNLKWFIDNWRFDRTVNPQNFVLKM
jgi:hypothetical protein